MADNSILNIPIPKKVWACMDCGTISDEKTSNQYHVGCVGKEAKPNAMFKDKKKPVLAKSGEIIWINKEEPK